MNKIARSTKRFLFFFSALTFLYLPGYLFAGDVFKWTDENGVIHYSDTKPKNTDSTTLRIRAGKSKKPRTPAQQQAKNLENKNTETQKTQNQSLQNKNQTSEIEAQCKTLRDNLKKFAENSRIKINEDGNHRFLTPEEISEKKEKYQKAIKEHCN